MNTEPTMDIIENVVVKTSLGFFSIILVAMVATLFGLLFYIMIMGSASHLGLAGIVVKSVFVLGAFLLFSLTLFAMSDLHIITLTNRNLILSKPLRFERRVIPLSNIKSMQVVDFTAGGTSRTMFNQYKLEMYNGSETLIELSDGLGVAFNSLDIPEYFLLNRELRKALRTYKGPKKSDTKLLPTSPEKPYWFLLLLGIVICVLFASYFLH